MSYISLGSNCHPAYWLKNKNLRNFSTPFDWLLFDSTKGLDYILNCVETEFSFWLNDLYINSNKKPVSTYYPYVEFFHHTDIVSNKEHCDKLRIRSLRFLQEWNSNENIFVYCYRLNKFNSSKNLEYFKTSVEKFLKKTSNKLIIYFLDDVIHNNDIKIEGCETYMYFRDKNISKVWGECPQFLLDR